MRTETFDAVLHYGARVWLGVLLVALAWSIWDGLVHVLG